MLTLLYRMHALETIHFLEADMAKVEASMRACFMRGEPEDDVYADHAQAINDFDFMMKDILKCSARA